MKLRLLTVLAVLTFASSASTASAGYYHPQAQAKWALAVATWTKQARAIGRETSCGRAFRIFPQCNFGPTGVFDGWNGSTSFIKARQSIDSMCVWNVTVGRLPNRPATGYVVHQVVVDICRPGWLSMLPHPS
jgi:hypothetical protein